MIGYFRSHINLEIMRVSLIEVPNSIFILSKLYLLNMEGVNEIVINTKIF